MNFSQNIRIGLSFHYSIGQALTKFYLHLKAHGTFLAAVCPNCEHTYFPPLLYCPVCLATIEKWKELGPKAKLISEAMNADGVRIGMLALEGSEEALFFHKILVKEQLCAGMELLPVIEETEVLPEILQGFRPL